MLNLPSITNKIRAMTRHAAPTTYTTRYLTRQLNDHNYVKELTKNELLSRIGEHKFHTAPYLHQLACIYLGTSMKSFLFLLEMGLGKTRIILDILSWRKARGQIRKTIVLVPNVVNIASWVAEIKKHAPHLRYVRLDVNSRSERQARLEQDGDIYLVNYAGLLSLMTTQAVKVGGRRGKRVIDPLLVNKVVGMFDCVVYDESHRVGNTKTLTFKLCNEISRFAKFRYALTGTPFGRDPMLLWGQYYLVDRGETLGFKLNIFREIFFRKETSPYGLQYTFRKRMKGELNRLLQHRAILYKTAECMTLPKLVSIPVKLELPKDMSAHYAQVLEEARNIRQGDYTLMQNVFMRMRQIASGFIRLKDEEDNERIDIKFGFNPKLEALMEIVEELPEDAKMVVFHEFLFTGKMISDELTNAKIKHARLYGATKDKGAVLEQFQNDTDCKILVANSASGGTGVNLQVANYVVFFESPVSPIVRVQAERRCYRTGQSKPVFMYDLIMDGTMDVRILDYIKQGKDLFREICERGVDRL